MSETGLPAHGELWLVEGAGFGTRPVVVLSRDVSIPRLRRVMVAPATTTIRGLDTEVELDPATDPVSQQCVVNLDSVDNVGVERLTQRLGRLDAVRMDSVCDALDVAVDCQR